MRKKVLKLSVCFILISFLISGCDYVNISVAQATQNKEGFISRKSSFWSGFTQSKMDIKEEKDREIKFTFDMKEGTVTFIIKNKDGEELYTLTREGECQETVTYTFDETGRYNLTEKGSKFKGSYELSWGNNIESSEDTDNNS